MNAGNIEITPHEKYKGLFRVVLTSQSTNRGKTTIELICSEELIRHIRNQCNKTLDENLRTPEEEAETNELNGRLKDFK